MTRVQRTLVLALGAVALMVAALGWIALRPPSSGVQAKAEKLLQSEVFAHAPMDVTSGEIQGPDQGPSGAIRFRMTPRGPLLEAPIQGPADAEAIHAAIVHTLSVPMVTELEADARPDTLARYGLEPPNVRVRLELTNGRKVELRLGAQNALTKGVFIAARDGDGPMRLGQSPGGFEWALDRDLAAFRAKQLFPLGAAALRRVTVLRDGALRFRVTRTSTPTAETKVTDLEWSLEAEGRVGPGDATVLSRFALLLTRDLRADAWITDALGAEPERTLALLGLSPPTFVVDVEGDAETPGAARPRHRLRVGVASRAVGDRLAALAHGRSATTAVGGDPAQLAVFVHLEGSTSIARVYDALPEDLDKGFDALADHDLTHFVPGRLARVSIDGKISGRRDLARQGPRVVRRDRPEAPVAIDAAREWLMRWSGVRTIRTLVPAADAAAKARVGLEPPAVVTVLYDADDRVLATVQVGPELDPEQHVVWVEEPGRAPRIEVVAANVILPLVSKLERLDGAPSPSASPAATP